MTDRAYIVSRTLEDKIAIAENNDQNVLFVTIDALKEILAVLKQKSVVRCKDCKHHLECDHWIENGNDWYCADAEREDDNV